MDDETQAALRVGDIARITGLTIRTLHYYEELGLVSPARSTSGHRLYGATDVERLLRIQLMRALGLPLTDVAAALTDGAWDPAGLVRQRIQGLDASLAAGHRLRDQLASALTEMTDDRFDLSTMLTTLEELSMYDTAVRRRIPTLVYADIPAAHDYLVRVFGFEPGEIARVDDGTAVHAELTAGDGVIWLHRVAPEYGLHSPAELGKETAGISIIVDDVDAHHARAIEQDATVRYAPTDQPYGYREYSATDLEGRSWSFMAPLA